MGEEAKQEEVKAEEKQEEKKEEKVEEKKEEKVEEKKEEPKPPSPVILLVDLHCVGCAKKIERSLMRYRGVEAVVIDIAQNQVTVKGVVDPQALCIRIQKKTKRKASIISPVPSAEGEPLPQFVTSQVSGLTTVELNVNMHCEACAQQLKKKILKMRGVQTVETELSTSKVTVVGTMDAQRLVDYVYRRTKKQAQVVPQPEPEPEPKTEPEPEKPEEKKKGENPPTEEAAKAEEKKEENVEKKEESAAKGEEEKVPEEEKKEESKGGEEKVDESKEAEAKKEGEEINNEETINKMMYHYPPPYYMTPPLYVIERIPAPQIFSDENPNACCIS